MSVNSTNNLNEEVKESIMRFCGYSLLPVERKHITEYGKLLKLRVAHIKDLVTKLVLEGRLVEIQSYREPEYRLRFEDYPKYFIPKLAGERQLFKKTHTHQAEYYRSVRDTRDWLYECYHGEKAILHLFRLNFSSRMLPILASITTSEGYDYCLKSFNDEQITILLYQLAYELERCQSLNAAEHLSRLVQRKTLSSTLHKVVLPIQHFFQHSLTLGAGFLVEQHRPHEDSAYSFYNIALQHQYKGEVAKALTNYNKGIRAGKKPNDYKLRYETLTHVPKSPFFCLMYLIALGEDSKQSSEKKLKQIWDADQYNESQHLPLSSKLYLFHLLDKRKKFDNFEFFLDDHDGLDFVLAVIVLMHYKLGELLPDDQARACEIIERHHWDLLKLEAGHALPALAGQSAELKKKWGISPILKPYVELEAWERQLARLDKLISVQAPKKTEGAKSDYGRIIYLIDDDNDLYPILQKSKDGKTWTKGRSIALNSMAKGKTEFMSEVDKAFARCIDHNSSWHGYGDDYYLDNENALVSLINHPHVYLSSNRDISVQILEEAPYLEVKQTTAGFTVKSNIKPGDDSPIQIIKESDVVRKVFKISALQRDILKLFRGHNTYPLAAKERLSQLISSISSLMTVHSELLRENTQLRQKKGSARITVQILPMADGVKVELFSKPQETHPPYFKAGKGLEVCLATDDEGQVNVTRDLKKERANYNKVRGILRELTQDDSVEETLIFGEMYDCLELLDQLQNHEKELRIEWPKGAQLSIRGKADSKQLRLAAFTRGQWLQVEGEIQVDKQLQLSFAELLERSRNNQGRFIELGKGEYLALSEKLRKQLAEMDSALSQNKKGELQLSAFRSELLSKAEQEGCTVQADKKLKELQERIQAAYDLKVQIPPTLTAQLRDYQIDGYEWLSRLAAWGAGACLADDMGLGKSVQSIAIMLDRAAQGASLIVAPASVVPNWKREIERFAPSMKCHLLHEHSGQRTELIAQAGAYDIVITTYGLLSRMDESITKKQWNVIVLDEAHNIKNRDTKCSKIAMSLQGDFRLALTGTPIQNHLGEIWNLFQFTNPGLLGSFEQFKEKFITPIEKEKNRARQQQLKRSLQAFLLRRTKSEVLDELPSKTEIIHHVELSAEERAVYENIRQTAIKNLEQGQLNPIQTLAEITKLRQAACHPQLIDAQLPIRSSAKLKRLLEIVAELLENKHSALVFSQFTSFLAKVKQALDVLRIPYFYLDGQTPIKERERLVAAFQQGKCPLFLISLKAGGTGLNLTAADYVIHMDPWWNPAIEDQASDRSHRIGQTRPVTIYKLIATQTIEDRIIELHKSKKSLSDALLEGGDMSTKLSQEEMMQLLQESF